LPKSVYVFASFDFLWVNLPVNIYHSHFVLETRTCEL